METQLKIAGLIAVTVSIPTFISVLAFNQIPSFTNLCLLIVIALASLLPVFGFDISKALDIKKITIETAEKTAAGPMVFNKPDTLIQHFEPLKEQILDLTDLEKHPAGNTPDCLWNVVLINEKQGFKCSVQKRVG